MTPFYSQWKCVLMQNFHLKGEIGCHFSVWSFLVSFAAGFSNVNVKVTSAWYSTVRGLPPVPIFSSEHLVCASDPPLGGPESQWVQVVPARAQLPHWSPCSHFPPVRTASFCYFRCQRASISTVWTASFMVAVLDRAWVGKIKTRRASVRGAAPIAWAETPASSRRGGLRTFALPSFLPRVPRPSLQPFASSPSHTVRASAASPVMWAELTSQPQAFWPLKGSLSFPGNCLACVIWENRCYF